MPGFTHRFIDVNDSYPDKFNLSRGSIRWTGEIECRESGIHKLQLYSSGYTRMWLNGELVVDAWRQNWLPWTHNFRIPMEKGARYPIKIEWIPEGGFMIGMDAWWMDVTEPDIQSNLSEEERRLRMHPTAIGSAARYLNTYSLAQARAVFEGQIKQNPDQRVFILTRSAYAGQQRYGAATWSGDVAARWEDLRNQVPAGLNFSMAGIPYWTTDIGGFAVEQRYINAKGEDLEEWRELMTRWFQFGTFCPLLRIHGQYPYREIYNVAPENHPAYQAMADYDNLRYRLMPYIYSLAGMVTQDGYTIMRALVMDFPDDPKVRDIGNQYMFGPALLVSPVTEYKARSADVYLPKSSGWYDLREGRYFEGGRKIKADAPYSG